MGKSPGKWIKSVLFGKKSSKSVSLKKSETGKEAFIVAKAPSCDLGANLPLISDPEPFITGRSEQSRGIENGTTANLSHDAAMLLPGNQDTDTKETPDLGSQSNVQIVRQEQAAVKVQAALRGYLARRAFWALKGIIRLQALIRGHLVRRQAVATLRCVQGIVKLQALVRGRRIRLSESGLGVQKLCSLRKTQDTKLVDPIGLNRSTQSEKLSKNAFVRKLLASSPNALPLSLQYDPIESNSAWNWLERWSSSHFWEPLVRPSRVHAVKSQKNLGNKLCLDPETGRPKRSVRRVSTTHAENSSLISTLNYGKPKNSLKKAFGGHQAELVPENPQIELERVKQNLRKISASTTESNDRSEAVTEKPKHKAIKVSSSSAPVVSQQVIDEFSEKISDPTGAVSIEPETWVPTKLAEDEPVDLLHDEQLTTEPLSLENSLKNQNIRMVNEESISKENQTSKENHKTKRRSLPSKQEYPENGAQDTPTLPSYMLATESAKAKLRGQGSARFSQDGAENGYVRRHSLPSSPGNSQRMQKLAQVSSKGGTKGDRSLMSSRDNNERVIQAEWKR